MRILHVPQRRPHGTWSRLQRFFRFEGRLGGMRYRANLEMVEPTPPDAPAPPRQPDAPESDGSGRP